MGDVSKGSKVKCIFSVPKGMGNFLEMLLVAPSLPPIHFCLHQRFVARLARMVGREAEEVCFLHRLNLTGFLALAKTVNMYSGSFYNNFHNPPEICIHSMVRFIS